MQKTYTTLKMGYSKGIYGCSNEYFTTIIIDQNAVSSVSYKGMYGVEQRIGQTLRDKGFTEVHTPHDYGRIPNRNVWAGFLSGYEAIEYIKANY